MASLKEVTPIGRILHSFLNKYVNSSRRVMLKKYNMNKKQMSIYIASLFSSSDPPLITFTLTVGVSNIIFFFSSKLNNVLHLIHANQHRNPSEPLRPWMFIKLKLDSFLKPNWSQIFHIFQKNTLIIWYILSNTLCAIT